MVVSGACVNTFPTYFSRAILRLESDGCGWFGAGEVFGGVAREDFHRLERAGGAEDGGVGSDA